MVLRAPLLLHPKNRALMMPDYIRAFVGLRLSDEVELAVADFIESLQLSSSANGAIRWVGRVNLHLTLRFLGDRVAASTLARLDRGLVRISAATAQFTIGVRGTGAFPNLTRPRVLWVGLESSELIELAARIERAAIESGLAPERRAYSPHLTIGRAREFDGWNEVQRVLDAASQREFGPSSVQAMMLYRSMLAPGGASYKELARYSFDRR
jgi:2'-5' RNA ligase